MTFIPNNYIEVLRNRHFFVLIATLVVGQLASAFLTLSLITSVFERTGSNFGVSGVVLSIALPAFLMVIAGIVADFVDRKKLILLANFTIAIIVLLILLWLKAVVASIFLAFLYYAINSFFIPAASAASGQLVKKDQLLAANSIFLFAFTGPTLFGFFIAALIQFFWGPNVSLIVCEVLLIIGVIFSLFLPPLPPREEKSTSLSQFFKNILAVYRYIWKEKVVLFFFVIFAFSQGYVAFGATLAPGFFNDIIGLPIAKSPIFFLPMVGLGVLLGVVFTHNPKKKESTFISLGMGVLGTASVLAAFLVYFTNGMPQVALGIVGFFLIVGGFSIISMMVGARTVLQKRVAHNYQGSIFGAVSILSAIMAVLFSPFGAILEALFGYLHVLVLSGILLLAIGIIVGYLGKRWKF